LGATTPLGLLQYSVGCGLPQEPADPARGFRRRRCLLKGCEQFYRPIQPQSRYCSESCRQDARRWRRCQASRTWRSSVAGQRRRREQSRRYRQRIPLPMLCEPPAVETSVLVRPPIPESREGQRPATILADFSDRPCQRPGCYVVFAVASALSPQRFCSCGCRRALRNVLDREARYRRRRRVGYRPRPRRSRPVPSRPP
jgi:hypothetical protein